MVEEAHMSDFESVSSLGVAVGDVVRAPALSIVSGWRGATGFVQGEVTSTDGGVLIDSEGEHIALDPTRDTRWFRRKRT